MRQALKSWTRVEHERVDEAISTLQLAQQDHYARFLALHLFSYQRLAHACDLPQLNQLIDLLCQDLSVLKVALKPHIVPLEETILHPIGVSYVIGGSNFGKSILRKRWAGLEDPLVLSAGAFMTSDINRQIWLHFQSETDGLIVEPSEHQNILQSARRCFEIFEQEFNDTGKRLEQSVA